MKRFLSILFFVAASSLVAQSSKTDDLIKALNNDQFIIHHDEKASFETNSPVMNKLIRKGKKNKARLLAALDDPERVIMVHLVLCHIYHKHASFAGPKIVSGNEANIYKYFLGEEKGEGLIISETRKNGNFRIYVEDKDREKIKEYWKKKTGA